MIDFFFESVERKYLVEKSLQEQKLFTFFYIKIDLQNYRLYLLDLKEQNEQIQEQKKQRSEENSKSKLEEYEINKLEEEVKKLKSEVKIREGKTKEFNETHRQSQSKRKACEKEIAQLSTSSKKLEEEIKNAENTIKIEFKGKKAKLLNKNHFEIFDELTKEQKFIRFCPWLVAGFSSLPLACIVGIMLLFFLLMPMPNLSLICFISAISLSVIYTLFLALVMFCFQILENVYDKKAQADFERLNNELNQNKEQLGKTANNISAKREECENLISDLDANEKQINENAKKLEKIKITLQTKEEELVKAQEKHDALLKGNENMQLPKAGLEIFSIFTKRTIDTIILEQFICLNMKNTKFLYK